MIRCSGAIFHAQAVTFLSFLRFMIESAAEGEEEDTDEMLIRELYERYSREIFLYLYAMCSSRETAEDLTQECFVRALLSLPKKRENLRAWLYRVARNLLIDELRRRRAENTISEAETLPLPDGDPQTAYLQDETRRELLRYMAELSPKKREVLVLQYYSGIPQREIAALLGVSYENVRVLAMRARKELKEKLKEKEP